MGKMGKIGEMGEMGKISPLAFCLLTTTPVASTEETSATHWLHYSLLTTLIASNRGSVASLLGVLELG